MVQWVVGSILHEGPIELFLVPTGDPLTGVTKAVVCVILSHRIAHTMAFVFVMQVKEYWLE